MFIKFIDNKCKYSRTCWNYDCAEWCPHYRPRLFGFIPVPRKIGEWLEYLQEKLFFKFCVKIDQGESFDFDFEGDEHDEH